MYWADARAGKIQRGNLDGSEVEDLITSGLDEPSAIVLDVAGGRVYWTETPYLQPGRIRRANLDGSNVEDLVTDFSGSWGMALDAAGGKMYWTASGPSRIQRANLDGSDIEDLVATGLGSPRGIALDLTAGQMYWATFNPSKIQRANLDGSDVEDLVTTGLLVPHAIALDLRPTAIPTLSEWGMLAMTILLLASGAIVIARRSPSSPRGGKGSIAHADH